MQNLITFELAIFVVLLLLKTSQNQPCLQAGLCLSHMEKMNFHAKCCIITGLRPGETQRGQSCAFLCFSTVTYMTI